MWNFFDGSVPIISSIILSGLIAIVGITTCTIKMGKRTPSTDTCNITNPTTSGKLTQ